MKIFLFAMLIMSLFYGCTPKDTTDSGSEETGGVSASSLKRSQDKNTSSIIAGSEVKKITSTAAVDKKRFSKDSYFPANKAEVEIAEDKEVSQSQIEITETPESRSTIQKSFDKRYTLDKEEQKLAGLTLKCVKGHRLEAGLCYSLCQEGDKGIGPLCFKSCPEGFADDGLLCRKNVSITTKKSYGRGVGKIPGCSDSEDRNAGLCYKKCKEGYKGVGPVCWQACPSGYKDHPASCYKHIFSWYFKKSYGRGVGKVGSSCPTDNEKQAGLCYKKCSIGYSGRGPVCWIQCPDGYKDDGVTCRKDLIVVAKKSYGRSVKIPTPIVEPNDVAPPSTPLAKHVFILGIDGLGSKNITSSKIKGKIPNIDFIKNNGAWTHNAYIDPTKNMSGPNWQGILTGTSSTLSGVVGNDWHRGNGIITIFDLLYEKNPNAEIGLIYDWGWFGHSPLNIDKFYNFYYPYASVEELSTDVIGRKTVSYITQNKPQLLFTYFGQVDIMGHEHSGGSDEYANALIRIDGEIGKILEALRSAGMLEETLIILTADHGHLLNLAVHSTALDPVPFYIMGPNIKRGEMKWRSIVSTNRIQNNLAAPLAAYFLGLERPDEWENSVYRLLPYIYGP